MQLSELIRPRNVDEKGAAVIVGKQALFRKMVDAGWIAPVVRGHSCTLYAVGHVEGCCDLLEAGFMPGTNNPRKAEIEAAMAGAMRPAYAKA